MRTLAVRRGVRTRDVEPVEVRSHSGFRQGEYPKSIFLDGAWRPVEAIIERWLEEDRWTRERRRCFVVRLCRREGTIRVFQLNEREWFLERVPGDARSGGGGGPCPDPGQRGGRGAAGGPGAQEEET
jgi:hypothetical protein